jgi:cellulose synthase operon protein C
VGGRSFATSSQAWRAALVLSLGALATSPSGPAPAPGGSGLDFEVSGCGAVLADGACERPLEGDVRLWIATADPVTVRIDGEKVAVAKTAHASGTRLALRLTRAGRVVISTGSASGILRVVDPEQAAWAAEAARARSQGDHGAARSLALPFLDDAEPAVRARAAGIVGRVDLAQGKIGGAITLLRRASLDAERAGRPSDAVEHGLALSFTLSQRAGRYEEARAELDRIAGLVSRYPDGNARLPYYRALVSHELGDVRAVVRDLGLARERAGRLGLARLEWNARNGWALLLERLGRNDDAVAELTALAGLDDPEIPACERANVLHNLGFVAVLRNREQRTPCSAPRPPDDPARWLRASLSLSEQQCPDAFRVAMGHVLLGEAALDQGRVDEAEAELRRGDLREASNELRRRRLDLEGRIALARGDGGAALATYQRLAAFARAAGRVDDERRALEGAGEALERQGRPAAAIEAFAEAEELLARASVLVPLGDGTAYRGARDAASRARIELLLEEGRLREALEVGRRARARLLSSVASIGRLAALGPGARGRWEDAVQRYREERRRVDAEGARDWELATSELVAATAARRESLARLRAALDTAMAALPGGEVQLPPEPARSTLLFVTSLRADAGAVVFVGADGDVRAVRLALGATEERRHVARRIVAAAAPELARAARVRIVTSADLACLDLHAEALGDGPALGLRVPVIYGADLGEAPTPSVGSGAALVVSDTRHDLPLARDEGALAAARLGRHVPVVHLSGARAEGSAVHEALGRATLLHYAGHAEEHDGEISLPLAGGGRLTASDVLALPSAPERVVLSACEAGRVDPRGLALGMGLVQAFLERGAREVLAPSRRVRDQDARDLAAALGRWDSADLSRAVQLLAAASPDADWAAYRVWGR